MATGKSEGAVASAMRLDHVDGRCLGRLGVLVFYRAGGVFAIGIACPLQARAAGGSSAAVSVTFPDLLRFQDLALLLLRLVSALLFLVSDYLHLKDPAGRA